MFFCTDVHYTDDSARAAGVGFWHSTDSEPTRRFVEQIDGVQPYEPGSFYKRELPCLLALLDAIRAVEAIDLVIVDGHAWLREGEPGLGHHLWEALGEKIPVFGVAKAAFHEGCAIEVVRGSSSRPLYVSAVGVDPHQAADFVRKMHGPHRLPTLLAEADALCRSGR